MVSSNLFPAMQILGSQNVYSRAEDIADHYWPWAIFLVLVAQCITQTSTFTCPEPLHVQTSLSRNDFHSSQSIPISTIQKDWSVGLLILFRFILIFLLILVTEKRFFERVRPSVRPSVRRSACNQKRPTRSDFCRVQPCLQPAFLFYFLLDLHPYKRK